MEISFKKKIDINAYNPGHIYVKEKGGYGSFIVYDGKYRDLPARLYTVDGVNESACYFGDMKYEPVFDYMKVFARHTDNLTRRDSKVLLIGGAGFTFPKYFISHYEDYRMDVVEMNPRSIEIAMEYFFLRDLEDEYAAFSSGRLRIFESEALSFLEESSQEYDMIINDAYHADSPDMNMFSPKALELFKGHLKKGCPYISNLITALSGPDSMRSAMAREMMSAYFTDVSIVPCNMSYSSNQVQNCLVKGYKK
ncbi:spermidine synthase [Butyrivibrio sp. MC2013]|uniref:spermidine synthase n=1 Tax=Butyrivibrio sp. MC2013 TaxID=1280686 RepID=UPI00041E5D57|nr:fused MFS/spermidine synthase [Butyrivibrio sp. MC2013]